MLIYVQADTLNGEDNGVDILLNAEQFNYAYHMSNGAGFKMALHSHLDLPLMQTSSNLVFTGSETQINLKPTISYTSEEAIHFFSPNERGCYSKTEKNLTYLKYI